MSVHPSVCIYIEQLPTATPLALYVTKWHIDVSIFGAQMLESCFRIMCHINIVSFITQSEGDGTTSTSTDRRGKCDLSLIPRPFPIE